ncbi:hypothetical protein HWV62_37294 [Athelia sp. TMB]|nr:hypothetical protein HWV62_37294 [Athelia sp. TMB]
MIGYNLDLVQVVGGDDGSESDASTAPSSIVPRHPTAEEIHRALESASGTFLGREWLVVFRGTRPGVYPSWSFVSSLVSGVSTAVYEKFDTKEEAEARWREAVRARQVRTLAPGVSYVEQD